MGPAMASVGLMSYALDKFIKTTLNEYNEYWWIKYRDYLENKYPGFVQSWAPLITQEGGKEAIDNRLYEFWDSDAQFHTQDAPIFYRNSEYAKNIFADSFAAKYYRDYLHQSLKTWVTQSVEREEARATIQFRANTRGLQQIIDELIILQEIIELAEEEMKEEEKTPLSLTISPAQTTLSAGETTTFTAFAIFEDDSITNISRNESTSWAPGNSFTAIEDGEFTVSVSYMGLSAQATVTVEGEETPHCNEPSEVLDEETGNCVCNSAEGYEMNEELGKCINIDKALVEVTEGGDALCDNESLIARLARLDEIVASGNRLAANFRATVNKFMKEVNDQNSDICENTIIAAAYAGAKDQQAEYQRLVDEASSLSTELILESSLCPLENVAIDITSILQKISQLGPIRGEMQDGLAMMEEQLQQQSCDTQEVEDQGDTIAERNDPEVIQAGGTGATEICGDGIDNDGNGLIDDGCAGASNFNVTISLYDSGNLADDVFGLSVSGKGNLGNTPEGGLRVYPLRLSPGSYVASITVIKAPDNRGTYTVSIMEGSQVLNSSTGSPSQGAVIDVPFSVGGNSDAAVETESMLPMLMNSMRQIHQTEGEN